MQTRLFVSGVVSAVIRSQPFRGSSRVSFVIKPGVAASWAMLAVALFSPVRSNAQLVSYSFGPAATPTAAAEFAAPSLTASVFAGNAGAPGLGAGAPMFTAGSGGPYFAASNWNAAAPGTNFFEFSLSPGAGFEASIADLSFGYRATASGPTGFALRSSADSFVSSLAVGTIMNDSLWHATGSIAVTPFSFTDATTFRLYAFGASGTAGTLRVDDVSLGGSLSAIPEPSTYAAIFGLLALGLAAWRRGRRRPC